MMLSETMAPQPMDESHFFADVTRPFHVWVREGRRWVLRDAGSRLKGDSALDAAREPAGSERPSDSR